MAVLIIFKIFMRLQGRLLAHLSALMALYVFAPTSASAELNSSQLFERVRPSVVEVVTQNKANLGVAAAASGFLTHKNDWVVTNYHAIADAIFEPEEYELRITSFDEKGLKLQILAVDIVNDLAILKLESPLNVPLLEIRETLPKSGELGYSMGKPGSYQHSIVSGTFNGLQSESVIPNIVFSGPINGGMSGGPTLDAQGRVVGVNVASSTTHQLIGLAVPAEALGRLIRKSTNQLPMDHGSLLKDISQQIGAYGSQIAQRLALPTNSIRQLGPFKVAADLSVNHPCSTTKISKSDFFYKRIDQTCNASSGLYVTDEQYAGEIFTRTSWIHSQSISPQHLARLAEKRLSQLRGSDDDEAPTGRWHCTEQRLRGQDDIPIQLHACRRPLSGLPGLYDFRFRFLPLMDGPDVLIVSVGLSGFDNQSAQVVIQRSIRSLSYTPRVKQ